MPLLLNKLYYTLDYFLIDIGYETVDVEKNIPI